MGCDLLNHIVMGSLNYQGTKDLRILQRVTVQGLYIKQLNKWLDELEWENEKKDTRLEMADTEIADLKNQLTAVSLKLAKSENEFKQYVNKTKKERAEIEKIKKQQDVIDELKSKLQSCETRLRTSHRMNELLAKQNKKS